MLTFDLPPHWSTVCRTFGGPLPKKSEDAIDLTIVPNSNRFATRLRKIKAS